MDEKGFASGNSGDLGWSLAVIAALLFLLLLHPGGFIGGGQDDWHYLNAARCWREFGPCLPDDHWQARWPVVAPIAAVTEVFGESRLTVSIAPLLASASAVFLLAWIGNRLFGRPVGWIATLLFLAIPAFAFQLTQPSVEATELALIFAGFLSILRWQSDGKVRWAFAAGFALSLAFQVRETALIAAVGAFAYVFATRPRPSLSALAWAFIGFAIPLLVEFLVFAIATGDPFWRRELALRHTEIPSSELLGGVSSGGPPLFNLENIANWRKQPGIEIHWAIDGTVNLFANVLAGLSLMLVPLLLVVAPTTIPAQLRRKALISWLVALSCIAVLIYVLAVDPKPRMMLVPLAIATLALALLSWSLHQRGRREIAYGVWVAALLVVLPLQVSRPRPEATEAPAAEWLKRYPGQIETDGNTRRYLALVRAARQLPGLDADEPMFLFMSPIDCPGWLTNSGFSPGAMVILDRALVTEVKGSAELCLLRYQRAVPAGDIRGAILRSTGNDDNRAMKDWRPKLAGSS